ncbi:serine hydrolase domain-containing protein [Maribellus sp. YY47]|uniref:serine hydrolase domain-containing protein n=1 Tax=Maribellus sp. YY47 TaxID=2929486 RepID=UPI002001101B|nr:serine hydrolase domain-containing protein [Maribellus sp. YY47]MCK3684517.1 beta-lactamase family protein [Maribellus sp. YY47]
MKRLLYAFIYISFVAILIACQSKPSADSPSGNVAQAFSASYKAPAFVPDERIEKIKAIAPEIQQSIEEHAKAKKIPGIAYGIVVDNQLIVASATGFAHIEKEIPATSASSFRIASMTKSFTAMAVIKLRDEGKLLLSDPVSQYIPELSNVVYLTKDAPAMDIENLLTMTAGFPEDNPWGDRQLDEPDQMLMDLVGEGVSFSNVPSCQFEYSNTGYALLGYIISRVSGMPYQEYITKNILQPLGMEHTYWEYDSVPEQQLVLGYRWEDEQWKLEPMLHDGSYGAMGGLITSIEDFAKYVSFHLSAWPPRNDDEAGPIKRSSLREMQTPQFPSLNAHAKDYNGEACPTVSGYGYGLGITEYCNGMKRVSHAGALPGFGSNYTFYPDYGVGIMAFCNLTYMSPWSLKDISKLLFETASLKPRKLPASDILLERQEQVTQLIQHWEPDLEDKILAENFYLDISREDRMAEVHKIFKKAGPIEEVGEIEPENQLRGNYTIKAQHGELKIYFTLTPEKNPKVQQLYVSFQEKDTK